MFDEFGLTEEQLAMQALARKFAQDHIKPIAADIDRMPVSEMKDGKPVLVNGFPATSFPWDMIREAHKIGFKTLTLPKEYGGEAADLQTQVVVHDELGYVDCTCGKLVTQCWKTPGAIVRQGTKEQKERFLPRYAKDPDFLIASASTEPDSDKTLFGSPAGGAKLAVERKSNGYVLNGIKHFIAIAGVSSLFVVNGRTDKNALPLQGTSQFLVPHDSPGISVRVHDKVGFRAYANGEIGFDNVFVPKENLLGGKENTPIEAGEMNTVELSTSCMSLARAAYDAAMDYAKTRVQGGKTIIEHQLVSGLLADMYMDLQAGRSFVWHVASVGKRLGKMPPQDLFVSCTRFCAKTALKITTDAMGIFGGYGAEREMPMERYVRDALIFLHIGGGTTVRQSRVAYMLGGLDLDGKRKSA